MTGIKIKSAAPAWPVKSNGSHTAIAVVLIISSSIKLERIYAPYWLEIEISDTLGLVRPEIVVGQYWTHKDVKQNVLFSTFKDQPRDHHSSAPLLAQVEAPAVTRGHFVVHRLQPGD